MTPSVEPTHIDARLLRGWPLPDHDDNRGKEGRGTALIVAGSVCVPGAALLAGEAALRVGAGKLQVATATGVAVPIALALPEAKVLSLPSTASGHVRGSSPLLDKDAAHADAILIGAGMEDSPSLRRLVERLMRRTSATVVADAGAIAAFHALAELHTPAVLTPHPGEMASLLECSREDIESAPARVAMEFASRAGVIVVLKGVETWIATPQGRLFLHTGGCIGLGTSGSGDVLGGLIAGLIARGATADQAAAWGVYLHGRAGEELAEAHGRVGFLAREISARIPRILDTL